MKSNDDQLAAALSGFGKESEKGKLDLDNTLQQEQSIYEIQVCRTK